MSQRPLIPIKTILAKNVKALLERDYPGDQRGRIGRFLKDHKTRGLSLSKLQRASGDGAVNLQTVALLARAFNVAPYQLFIEGLNVKEPQIAIERRYVSAARQMAKTLAAIDNETDT